MLINSPCESQVLLVRANLVNGTNHFPGFHYVQSPVPPQGANVPYLLNAFLFPGRSGLETRQTKKIQGESWSISRPEIWLRFQTWGLKTGADWKEAFPDSTLILNLYCSMCNLLAAEFHRKLMFSLAHPVACLMGAWAAKLYPCKESN